MKYHQLEAFYQVMITGSISRAAKNLGRTQPAVSMTINTLEEQLNTVLFDRRAGRITPRAEANVLFEQVSLVMRNLNDIRQRFGQLKPMTVPRISIISSNIAGTYLVPAALSKLAESGQEFRLMNATSATIISEMENQLHDIAVVDQGTAEISLDSPLFEAEVFKTTVCAIFPKGMLPQKEGEISIKDLVGYDICMLYEENRTFREVMAVFPSTRMEFSSFFPMACFAVMNRSIAIADFVTCRTLECLTANTLDAEWRVISDISPTSYYLLRSRYRARSKMTDLCYEAIRQALIAHRIP